MLGAYAGTRSTLFPSRARSLAFAPCGRWQVKKHGRVSGLAWLRRKGCVFSVCSAGVPTAAVASRRQLPHTIISPSYGWLIEVLFYVFGLRFIFYFLGFCCAERRILRKGERGGKGGGKTWHDSHERGDGVTPILALLLLLSMHVATIESI